MLSQNHIRGLLQSLDFSEGTGTTLNDKSGNGNNATVIGGTWTTDRFGRANRAILLDGVDDYIDLGLADYQGDIGMIVIAKVMSFVDVDVIIQKSQKSSVEYPPNFALLIRTTNNTLNIFNRYAGSYTAWGSNTLNAFIVGEWAFFYASAINATVGTSGTNGKASTILNTNINTLFSTGRPFKIGADENGIKYANLTVDRIMLFNRFLSGHELSKLANRLKIGDLDK